MLNWILANNDGKEFNFREFQGQDRLLVLFFRGVWCNLCKKQLADFAKNFSKFADRNIKIVAISPDTKFKSSLLKTFLNLSFPVLSDNQFKIIDEMQLRDEYQGRITSKPAVYLFSPEGALLYQKIGKSYDDIDCAEDVLRAIDNL